MDIIELYLDKGTTTTVHGDLYGLDFVISEQLYQTKIYLDIFNKRIQVIEYDAQNIEGFVRRLDYLAEKNNFGKVILKARQDDWEKLLPYGYVLEGIFKYYYQGEDGYCLSKFYDSKRRFSQFFDKAAAIMESVSKVEVDLNPASLPTGYEMRKAQEEDIPEISALYKQVFKTYPVPLNHPHYVESLMGEDYLFVVITKGGKIVSCASADIDHKNGNAEITDCASLPECRGKGLMYGIICSLEQMLCRQGIKCLYSLARALSPGMNTVFKKRGYTYTGRLINNCNIFGKFEDMNLWVKMVR